MKEGSDYVVELSVREIRADGSMTDYDPLVVYVLERKKEGMVSRVRSMCSPALITAYLTALITAKLAKLESHAQAGK